MCTSEVALLKKKLFVKLYYIFGLRLDLFLVHLSKYIWVKNVDKFLYHRKTKGLCYEP